MHSFSIGVRQPYGSRSRFSLPRDFRPPGGSSVVTFYGDIGAFSTEKNSTGRASLLRTEFVTPLSESLVCHYHCSETDDSTLLGIVIACSSAPADVAGGVEYADTPSDGRNWSAI